MVQVYDKTVHREDMQYIDYGLSVLSIDVFAPFRGRARLDLADVYSYLAREGCLAGFEVDKRFYEIGSPEGLRQTSDYIANRRS
jgi:NDP-sugar pyrophosphorylase family protein